MTLPVFLVPALPPGEEFVLDGPEGRHAATVRRLRVDEELVLSDGSGALVRCSVVEVLRDALALRVVERSVEPEPTPRVVLAQALVKGDRGELAVRHILGVLSLAKKYGGPTVDDACAAALEMGVCQYRFVRRYLERRPQTPLSLRQVDPLIRQLTLYRDFIQAKTEENRA